MSRFGGREVSRPVRLTPMLLFPERALPATASWRELSADRHRPGGPVMFAALSPAERMVAVCVAQGFSNREIAAALGKSESTVKHQVGACLRKLGVRTRGRLIALLR